MISAAGLLGPESVPERYRDLARSYELTGDSVIIDPRGEVIAGPAKGETILLAQCSQETVLAAKSAIDIGGHCSRPDILQLHVNQQLQQRVRRLDYSAKEGLRGAAPQSPPNVQGMAETLG